MENEYNQDIDKLAPYIERLNEIFERSVLKNPEYNSLREEIESAGFILDSLDLGANFVIKPKEEKVPLMEPKPLVQDGQIRKNTFRTNDRSFLKALKISLGEEE